MTILRSGVRLKFLAVSVALLASIARIADAIAVPPAIDGSCDPMIKHQSVPNGAWAVVCFESCGGQPKCKNNCATTDAYGFPAVTCSTCPSGSSPSACCHAVLVVYPFHYASFSGECSDDCVNETDCHLSTGGSPTLSTYIATCYNIP